MEQRLGILKLAHLLNRCSWSTLVFFLQNLNLVDTKVSLKYCTMYVKTTIRDKHRLSSWDISENIVLCTLFVQCHTVSEVIAPKITELYCLYRQGTSECLNSQAIFSCSERNTTTHVYWSDMFCPLCSDENISFLLTNKHLYKNKRKYRNGLKWCSFSTQFLQVYMCTDCSNVALSLLQIHHVQFPNATYGNP